jgi:adenylosuccinate synthase
MNGAAIAVTAELRQISAEALADPALIDPAFLDAIRMSRRRQRLTRTLLPVPAPSGRARTTWVGDLQQGDGGKGAMTDRLARVHHAVVRVQGGDNAGHTTVFTDTQGK